METEVLDLVAAFLAGVGCTLIFTACMDLRCRKSPKDE